MTKLHEILAAEKTAKSAWEEMFLDTLRKFKAPEGFFFGMTKRLHMFNQETPGVAAVEQQQKIDKPVITTVHATLQYALDVFARSENLQFQKNVTNIKAVGTIMWRGLPFIENVPVDELLGLENRLTKLRELILAIPTLDASIKWEPDPQQGHGIWVSEEAVTVKGEKQVDAVVLVQPTKEHPAQIREINKDVPVGKFTARLRSGTATAAQKATMIKTVDDLLIEIKQARVRTNETVVDNRKIGGTLVDLIMAPLETMVQ